MDPLSPHICAYIYKPSIHINMYITWDQWIASDLDCGDDSTKACTYDDEDGDGDNIM